MVSVLACRRVVPLPISWVFMSMLAFYAILYLVTFLRPCDLRIFDSLQDVIFAQALVFPSFAFSGLFRWYWSCCSPVLDLSGSSFSLFLCDFIHCDRLPQSSVSCLCRVSTFFTESALFAQDLHFPLVVVQAFVHCSVSFGFYFFCF